jgi:hypothetical protein
MLDPAHAQTMLKALTGGAPASPQEAELRMRQRSLGAAATFAAVRGSCNCEPCQFLRQSVDVMLEEARKEVSDHGPGDNPPPGAS